MIVIKRAGWQLLVALFTCFLHLIMVLVCVVAFLISPIAQIVWSRRRAKALKNRNRRGPTDGMSEAGN